MNVLILGGDGYLGWPTAMDFCAKGHNVCVVDNYLRRRLATETNSEPLYLTPDLKERARIFELITNHKINVEIIDCSIFQDLANVIKDFKPNTVIHYAEQPSAPYSMMGFNEAQITLKNNLEVTFNLIWAIHLFAPDCHIIKLGTMGEYGTPNIDIEEGWLSVEHNGRSEKFLYPRQAGSLYHTTKVLDTDLLWFYVRAYGIKVTDLMQGPVYGLSSPQCDLDSRLMPNFHYDDIFGTVINRFLVQAVAGVPLTVYGQGGQTRGYLNLKDTLQCVYLAAMFPSKKGELRVFNQFTETLSVSQIADNVCRVGNKLGLNVTIESIENPRQEQEQHYYNPKHTGLLELGLVPTFLDDDVLSVMLDIVSKYKNNISIEKIYPRVRWK